VSVGVAGVAAMTAAHDIDLPTVLADRLTTTHPDVLRDLLATSSTL
jgi:putative transposase